MTTYLSPNHNIVPITWHCNKTAAFSSVKASTSAFPVLPALDRHSISVITSLQLSKIDQDNVCCVCVKVAAMEIRRLHWRLALKLLRAVVSVCSAKRTRVLKGKSGYKGSANQSYLFFQPGKKLADCHGISHLKRNAKNSKTGRNPKMLLTFQIADL